MTREAPVLHMICGMVASGKSTLATQLAEAEASGIVILSEDIWLGALYGDQMATLNDYVHASSTLRGVIGPHVVGLLRAGVSVVLDFAANTVQQRRWMRNMLEQSGANHRMHVLCVPDEICRARLHNRNQLGGHPFTVSDTQFDVILQHFVPPGVDEGFDVEYHGSEAEF